MNTDASNVEDINIHQIIERLSMSCIESSGEPFSLCFFALPFWDFMMSTMAGVGIATGAAKRRRERRLRSWLKHERMTVAMALAEASHHTAPRGQRTARVRGWVRGEVHGHVPEAPTSSEPGTRYFSLDDNDSVPELGGSRPDRLVDVRPQERVPRRIVEQTVDTVPVVQLLHVPVPQMVDSVVEVLKILDKSVPDVEQVIEVPKILQHVALQRSSLQEPQLAEQLVEVPTPSPALPPVPQMEHQLVEVPPIVPQLVGFFAGSDGYVWRQLSGPTGAYWWRVGSSHTQSAPPPGYTARPGRYRNTGPGWRGRPCIMLFVFQQSKSYVFCAAIQFIDRVRTFQLCHRREISQCSSWTRLLTHVVHNSCPWSRQCCHCVHRQGRWHPCSRAGNRRCLRFSHRQSSMTIWGSEGLFRRILRHFSRSSGCPGVERQFFELSSAHNCECSRAPRVPESPGVLLPGDSAPGFAN